MRILICWPEVSGYMAACWRALAARPGVDLRVIAYASGRAGTLARFAEDTTAGVPCRPLARHQHAVDAAQVRRDLESRQPLSQRPAPLRVHGHDDAGVRQRRHGRGQARVRGVDPAGQQDHVGPVGGRESFDQGRVVAL
ncbi:MAG: hypothetical protein ACAI43_03095, partial [Phycisphaerae bacterium]